MELLPVEKICLAYSRQTVCQSPIHKTKKKGISFTIARSRKPICQCVALLRTGNLSRRIMFNTNVTKELVFQQYRINRHYSINYAYLIAMLTVIFTICLLALFMITIFINEIIIARIETIIHSVFIHTTFYCYRRMWYASNVYEMLKLFHPRPAS